MQWCQTEDGIYVWISPLDDGMSLKWDGPSLSGVANGNGQLTIKKGTIIQSVSPCCMRFGSINGTGFRNIDDNQKFLGSVSDGHISGFCVYIKGNDIYIGNFINGLPDGKLNLYKDGDLYYSGEWSAGEINGEGTLFRQDGTQISGVWINGKIKETTATSSSELGLYSGKIVDNKPNGAGQMIYANGCEYKGGWKDGSWHGDGVLKTNTFNYIGCWENNLPEGYGEIFFSDSSFYKGNWSDGKRDDWGECLFANNDAYYGEWINDLPNGEGVYRFHDGSFYDGDWRNGLQDGLGKFVTQNFGYEGEWSEGWANGVGRFTYSNGDVYDGQVVENERYGQGTYYYENGNVYDGEFVDDTFNGLGVFYFSDGSWYEGEFKNGKICGDGTYNFEDEGGIVSITAVWDGSNSFPNKASIVFPNGDMYEGKIIDGKPTDDGIWFTADGKQHNAAWMAQFSEFYDAHRKAINRGVIIAGVALTVAAIALPGGWAVAAMVVNTTINVADATTSIANEAYKGNYSAAVSETAINVAFIAAPAVLRKPARKAAVVLSASAKQIGKAVKPVMSAIGGSKAVRQVVKVVKGKAGKIEKKILKAVPEKLKKAKPQKSFQSHWLATRLAKTLIKKKLDEIEKKGAIKLTQLEMQQLQEYPKEYIRHFILAKTGNKKSFQEFFIRLAMGDKNQVKELLSIPEIRQFVDRSIRHSGEGGVHEWLMTKNFEDFLTNPKWGDDGHFLALALTELVQKTSRVLFKNGGQHHMANSGRFHLELAKVIENCSTKEELFIAIHRFAKQWLTNESYQEFCQIFKEVFLTAIE